MPYVWLAGMILAGLQSYTVLTTLLSLPLAIKNVKCVLSAKAEGIAAIARLDEFTAKLQLAFSVLLMIGLALGYYLE